MLSLSETRYKILKCLFQLIPTYFRNYNWRYGRAKLKVCMYLFQLETCIKFLLKRFTISLRTKLYVFVSTPFASFSQQYWMFNVIVVIADVTVGKRIVIKHTNSKPTLALTSVTEIPQTTVPLYDYIYAPRMLLITKY